MTDDLEIGPVDYVVVEFPGNKMTGEGLPILLDLHDRGIIRILDLKFVTKDVDGVVDAMAIGDFDGDGSLDLALFTGLTTGIIDDDDVTEASAVLEPNTSAGILVYENAWAAPFVGALRRSGAELVASGRIPAADLIAAVEAADARD